MKTFKKIIDCLEAYIKKNFFKLPKTDIPQDCKKILGLNFGDEKEKSGAEEYATVYRSTTRWQTL